MNRVWCRQKARAAAAAVSVLRPARCSYHSVLYFIFNWKAIKLTRCCVRSRSQCSRWARNERSRANRETRNHLYKWTILFSSQSCTRMPFEGVLATKYEETVPALSVTINWCKAKPTIIKWNITGLYLRSIRTQTKIGQQFLTKAAYVTFSPIETRRKNNLPFSHFRLDPFG